MGEERGADEDLGVDVDAAYEEEIVAAILEI